MLSLGQSNYTAGQTEMEAIGAHLPNTVSVTVPPIVSSSFILASYSLTDWWQTDGGVFVRSMPAGNARSAALDKVGFFSSRF